MRTTLIHMIFFLLLFSTNKVQANDLKSGIAAFNNQDYVQARQLLGPLAHEANPEAMFYIGQMYDFGFGLPYNDYEAESWYSYAARKGHARASFYAAFLLREQKKETSKHLYSEAAKLNFTPATILEKGMQAYLKNEYRLAINIWEEEAQRNNKEAMCFLGELYNELSLKEFYDEKKSLHWYRKAAKAGHGKAAFHMSTHYWLFKKDKENATYWGLQSATNGFSRGYENIATMYFFEKDFENFIKWSKDGILNGCLNLTDTLVSYSGLELGNGCPNVAGPVGQYYLEKFGENKAIEWIETAIKKGDFAASVSLIDIYKKRPKTIHNLKKAYKWQIFLRPPSIGDNELNDLLNECKKLDCSQKFYYDIYKWTRLADRKNELRQPSMFPDLYKKNSKMYKRKYDFIESKLSPRELAEIDKHVKQCVSKYFLSYCQ